MIFYIFPSHCVIIKSSKEGVAMKINDVVDFFIYAGSLNEGTEMTNARVNKLLYFAQGWSLALKNKSLFDEPIEAWKLGPVVNEVYQNFKSNHRNPILTTSKDFDLEKIDDDDFQLLTDVFTNYMNYSTNALIDLTHEKGSPWSEVYQENKNVVIPNELIKQYFSQQKLRTIHDIVKDIPTVSKTDNNGSTILPEDYE